MPERTQAQPILKSILVKPAGPDCNMNCTYCFYLHKANLFPETRIHRMSVEVLEQFILQYMPIAGAQPSFCWQGGEPTLMGLEFFERVVHFQMKYGLDGQAVGNSIQTNGLLIDDDWARFMHEYRFLVGVSLDGPQEIHDYYRRDRGGHATFERVMKAIDVLRGHDVEFNILCVINDVNVRHPDTLFQFFIEHDLRFVQFIPCVERDTQTGNIADFSVSPEAYAEFLCRAFDLWYNNGQPIIYERFFNDVLAVYARGEMPTCIMRRTCGDYVVIEHNGDVYACDFFVEPEWKFGNLLERPLSELLRSERARQFKQRKRQLAPECKRCRWLRLCYGGCPKYRLFNGGVDRTNYFCIAYKRFFAHAHRRYLRLAERIM